MVFEAFIILTITYGLCLLLHLILPARVVEGYCCDNDGRVLKYRLNGFLMLLVSCAFFYYYPTNLFCTQYANFAAVAIVFGIIASTYFFLQDSYEPYSRCITKDQVKDGKKPSLAPRQQSAVLAFFLGHEWNPRILGVDVKMFLYAVGAIQLELNILSWGGITRFDVIHSFVQLVRRRVYVF